MKFYALTAETLDEGQLYSEYKAAREIGVVRLGEECFYFRKFRKVYYIPYHEICRCFRRVMLVPAKLCCGKGDLEVEHLVVCTKEGEAAQIRLPGTRAARALIEELKQRIPDAEFTRPASSEKRKARRDEL